MLPWTELGEWPTFEYVAHEAEQLGIDALQVLTSFPYLGRPIPHDAVLCRRLVRAHPTRSARGQPYSA